jgi:hypothetical protein
MTTNVESIATMLRVHDGTATSRRCFTLLIRSGWQRPTADSSVLNVPARDQNSAETSV